VISASCCWVSVVVVCVAVCLFTLKVRGSLGFSAGSVRVIVTVMLPSLKVSRLKVVCQFVVPSYVSSWVSEEVPWVSVMVISPSSVPVPCMVISSETVLSVPTVRVSEVMLVTLGVFGMAVSTLTALLMVSSVKGELSSVGMVMMLGALPPLPSQIR